MKALFLFVTLIAPLVAWSQLTMDEYRREVVEYSWTLKQSEVNVEAKNQLELVARTGFLPKISADGSFDIQNNDSQSVENWNFSLQPQIVETIYAGGSVRSKVKLAEINHEKAIEDGKGALLNINYSADYAYLYLWSMERYRDVVGEYVEIIRKLKSIVDDRYDEGYIAKSDQLMIETRLSEAEYQLIASEQNYTVALHNFNALRGGDPSDQAIVESIDVYGDLPHKVILEDIISNIPDYQSYLLDIYGAQSSVEITRSNYNPQLSVGVMGLWSTNTPNLNGATKFRTNAFLKLSIPIFRFFERQKAVAASECAVQISEYKLYDLIDKIRQDEANAWSKIIDSHAQMLSAQKSLDIATENLEISTYSYSEGLTTILDVMQAQISWIQLYTNTINSEFNYNLYLSDYKRITADFN